MTIETKYNIGDEVWAIIAGEPFKCKIDHIIVYNEKDIAYGIRANSDSIFGNRYEEELFPTKKELLKSL